ncbi:MAG: hypothetical protein NTZ90_05575, partial [Proteobacteria bacterium]|nr:hypothetical protein [Pseudomonadota bacterium]
EMYRRMVRLDDLGAGGVVVRGARGEAEHAAAFRLLHEAYVEAGYMTRDASGMRLSPYQLVPMARTVVAVVDGVVVATCGLIPDSPLGLPMDSVFDLGHLRRAGGRYGELSALAVKTRYRGQLGRLLFPMIRYLFDYGKVLGLDGLVFCVQPRHFDFYRAFLHAQPLPKGYAAHYGAVSGAPAQAGRMHFADSLRWGQRRYRNAPSSRNVYDYLVKRNLAHVESPEYPGAPVLSAAAIQALFGAPGGVIDRLTDAQRQALLEQYPSADYRQLFGRQGTSELYACRQ